MRPAEPSSFEQAVLPHLDVMFDVALRLLGSRSDAEDLVQEALVRALAAFPSLDRSESVRPWLLAIVRHGAQNRWREASRHPEAPLEAEEVAAEQVEEAPDWQRLGTEDLEALLPHLSGPAREVVVLRDLHGLSYKDVAAVLGCPVGTVMSRLHRGRAELRRLFLARAGPASRRSAG